MKHTLKSAHMQTVDPLLTNGVLPDGSYNNAKQRLHASFVEQTLNVQEPNPLLQRRPPPVHKSEALLPRSYRSTLSQLRSGHSQLLNDYRHRIGAAPSPTCPRCNQVDDTVAHLFDCQAHPTSLSLSDLWLYPSNVATFLSSLGFSDLPPLPPPPPEPPPSPPPSPPSSLDSTQFSPLSLNQSFFYSSISSISSLDESLGAIIRGADP